MIRIQKVDAQISISTNNAKLYINQQPADFDLRQKHLKIEMHTEQIRVQIDQRQCFNESGLKSNDALLREATAMGRQAALEAIGRIASEGTMLAAIEKGGNPIAEIAFNNTHKQESYTIDSMPKSRPIIDFVGGKVDIRIEEGEVILNTSPNKVEIDSEPGSVEISLKTRPQISIEFVGNSMDIKV
ncbi:MAG: DUF6470 family protein [Bacillota bacterium]